MSKRTNSAYHDSLYLRKCIAYLRCLPLVKNSQYAKMYKSQYQFARKYFINQSTNISAYIAELLLSMWFFSFSLLDISYEAKINLIYALLSVSIYFRQRGFFVYFILPQNKNKTKNSKENEKYLMS